MKKSMLRILVTTALFFVAGRAVAIDFISTNTLFRVAADETLDRQTWVIANGADIRGALHNDFFIAAAKNFDFSGTAAGNVWATADTITLTPAAAVARNARLMGREIRVEGRIYGDLIALGQTVTVSTNALIGGELYIVAETVVIEGSVGKVPAQDKEQKTADFRRKIHVTASRIVTFSGTIHGDVSVTAPEIVLSQNAHIEGDFSYLSPRPLIPPEGTVTGNVQKESPPSSSFFNPVSFFTWFLAALAVGIPFLSFFPGTTGMAVRLVRDAPFRCAITGLFVLILLPFLIMMSLSSVAGIPLGLALVGAWLFFYYVGSIIVALAIGTRFFFRADRLSFFQATAALAVGLLILHLAFALPQVGGALRLTASVFGAGALMKTILQRRTFTFQAVAGGNASGSNFSPNLPNE